MEVVRHLQEGHPQLFFKSTNRITEFLNGLLYILEPSKMADGLGYFWKKLEFLRRLGGPGNHLDFCWRLVKSGIQFNRVELAGVIREFMFSATGIETLKISLVPLGTTYLNLKRLFFICVLGQYLCRIGMIFG